jgi:hypothetical protein
LLKMREEKPSVGFSSAPNIDAIQWTVPRLFEVSLTTSCLEAPPSASTTTLGSSRLRRTGLGVTVIALVFSRKPAAVGHVAGVIERLLAEEPALGDCLQKWSVSFNLRQMGREPYRGQSSKADDPDPRRLRWRQAGGFRNSWRRIL